jgi:hypothetical protein
LITWKTSHYRSLKSFRLVPVKSLLLKLERLGCSKFRGKYEVAFGSSLQRSPISKS